MAFPQLKIMFHHQNQPEWRQGFTEQDLDPAYCGRGEEKCSTS